MGKKNLRVVIYAAICASLLTLLTGLGGLNALDLRASDKLYQTRSASDGQIVLIGIDQRAIDEIGPYSQWGRDVIASVIDTLNQSEENRPAVIGLDILYTGKSDPKLDQRLAEAAGKYGNVVSASAFQFGDALVQEEDEEYYIDDFSVLNYEEPYAGLKAASAQGHINAMLDADGILRHHLLKVARTGGKEIPSFALVAANAYRDYLGEKEVLLPPVNPQGFWYLPYCGVPGDFYESISVADVVSGTADAGYFAGKIVLIGPYAPGLQDSYTTSADHARQMYGVEVQANAIQALLWGEYKKEVKDSIQLAVLFFVLFGAFWGFWKRKVLPSTALWIVLCGGWVVLCRAMSARGHLLHVLWIPICASVLYIGCIAVNYVVSTAEKRRVTNTFKRYVDPAVIQELLREGSDALDLGGKLTDIAVLFVDIRGFTTMSEMMTAPQVVEILNQYLTLTTHCVMDNQGTLDKFVGDCTMAIWNAPLAQEDYIMKACKAAMDMVKGSGVLAEKLQKEFGRTVSFGIGIHTGPAVVGNIGAPMRMDYTAIGDTVNTAARLEANAPAGRIYISRAVADALEGRIRATSLGETIKLKGKKEGFEILVLDEIV